MKNSRLLPDPEGSRRAKVPSSHIGALFLSSTYYYVLPGMVIRGSMLCGEPTIITAKCEGTRSAETYRDRQRHEKSCELRLMFMSSLHWGIDWDIARGPTPEGKTEDQKLTCQNTLLSQIIACERDWLRAL